MGNQISSFPGDDDGVEPHTGVDPMFSKVDADEDCDKDSILCLAVSPNLQYLASGELHALRIWDLFTGEVVASFRTEGPLTVVRFTGTGSQLLAACNNVIVSCNMSSMDQLSRIRTYASPISTFSLSPNQQSSKLVTSCCNNVVYVGEFGLHEYSAAYQQSKKSSKNAQSSTRKGKGKESHRMFKTESIAQTSCFSPDGRYIAFGFSSGGIRAFSSHNNRDLGKFTPHHQAVLAIDIAWAGVERQLMVATGSADNCVRVHALLSSTLQFELDGHTRSVNCVAFTADGLGLATGSNDCSVALWSMITGCQLWLFLGHTATVNTLLFVPAIEEYMISGSDDRSIRLWNVRTGKQKGYY